MRYSQKLFGKRSSLIYNSSKEGRGEGRSMTIFQNQNVSQGADFPSPSSRRREGR
jgi:hypothetical protein